MELITEPAGGSRAASGLPAHDAAPLLDSEVVAAFRRDGFAHIAAIAPPEDVAQIREIYDNFFATRRGWEKGDFFDTRAADDAREAMQLPQMFWLSKYEPSLKQSAYHRNATAIARQLLGPGAELVWEFAILKPPQVGAETPWHQDEAFFTIGTDYDEAMSFWMPLQDVGPHNGCMRFVPGSNHGPLYPHDHVGGDPRTHGLEAQGPDLSSAVLLPLPAGAASFHHSRTLHSAGPNPSGGPRRAYILEFAVHDKARVRREDFAWNKTKRTARDVREWRATPLRERLVRELRGALARIAPRG